MVWGLLISGLGNLGTSIFIRDEKARAAANLAIAGVAAGCCDPTGSGVVGAVVTVAKETTAMGMAVGGVKDSSVKAGVANSFSLVADAISLNPIGVAQTVGGAAAGATVGAVAKASGAEGFDAVSAMSMGSNLASGSIDEITAKASGAAVGAAAGAVATAATDEAGAELVTLGVSMGSSVGAGINNLSTTKAELVEQRKRNTSFLDDEDPVELEKISEEQVERARRDAAIRLAAQGVGLGAAVAVHAASDEEGDADLKASLRAGQAIGNSLGAAATADSKASAAGAALEIAGAAGTVVNEVRSKAKIRKLRRAAGAVDDGNNALLAKLEENAEHAQDILWEVGSASGGVSGLEDYDKKKKPSSWEAGLSREAEF